MALPVTGRRSMRTASTITCKACPHRRSGRLCGTSGVCVDNSIARQSERPCDADGGDRWRDRRTAPRSRCLTLDFLRTKRAAVLPGGSFHFEGQQINFPDRFCPMLPFGAPSWICHEHFAVHWGTFGPPPSERNAGHSSEVPLPERDRCLLGLGQVLSRAFLNDKEPPLNKRLTL